MPVFSIFLLFNLVLLSLKHISCSASNISPFFKFRVCICHCAVFYAAIPVNAVVRILVNPFISSVDPLDNLRLSPVSNEAENKEKDEEEDDDCYRYNHCYQNTIVYSFNESWLNFFC